MAVDTSIYERARRGVNDEYAATSASNAYSRFLSQQRGERQRSDAQRGFRRQFPRQTASFGQRGLSGGGVRSGTMQRAMQDFVGDHNRQMSRFDQDMAQDLRQRDLQQSQLDAWRQSALQDIEMQKQKEIASAALNLQALRPYLGGY